MNSTSWINRGWRAITAKLGPSWLPLALTALFVVQNHLFNFWIKIPVAPFFFRRTAATAALGALVFSPALLLRRGRHLYLALSSLALGALLAVQLLYHSYSGAFLQATAFLYAGEGISVLPAVKALADCRIIFFAAGPLSVLALWLLKKGNGRLAMSERKFAAIAMAALVAIGYGYMFLGEKLEFGSTKLLSYSRLYDVDALVEKIGVANFSLGDAAALAFSAGRVNAADRSFAEAYKAKMSPPEPDSDAGLLKGRNVIMIQVESLENAVIGQKIGGEEITPNLDRLSKEGLYFSNYYSPVGPGTTADAEFMTLDSLYSLPDGVAFIQDAFDRYSALPGLLKQNGYGTYSFHGDVPSFWNRANIYPQLGYDKWFGAEDYSVPRKIGAFSLGDADFFAQTLPKLEALPRPFFATLITLTSHTPFIIPSDLQTLDIPADSGLSWQQKGYLESVHYTDQAIGDFIAQLKAAGLYGNSLILIYGDHGSFTGIADALGADKSVFPDLQASQVPMIVLAPGTDLRGERVTPASHLDLYPTVADLLGIKAPAEVFGHDMIDGNENVAVSREPISGAVQSALTDELAFHVGGDGTFASGRCLAMPSRKPIALESCRQLYDRSSDAVRASDIMVKGDLIAD